MFRAVVRLGLVTACRGDERSSRAPTGTAAGALQPAVEIDLSPHGWGARICGPDKARVRVAGDEIEIQGAGGYHLLVGRGAVDPLQEKTKIVQTFQSRFERFLVDEGKTVIFETRTLGGESRYHFFHTGTKRDLGYHCRTPEEGVPRRGAVESMVDACRSVDIQPDLDPDAYVDRAPDHAAVCPDTAGP